MTTRTASEPTNQPRMTVFGHDIEAGYHVAVFVPETVAVEHSLATGAACLTGCVLRLEESGVWNR
ncbi:MAG: hypothetical protein E5V18_16510 [Mesorhizobium sp.]|nr:MAG: hypothetical protein EOQ41_22805 [Mesorhizobium sp.]TIT06493.1 MAG: hypothetical protein E5W85_27185 [Mesorhizobium sp.]TIU23960.1 MAG: hypothetical protein E5W53_13745 [Mesorhizobium sp.]TIX78626.1 MAG: hypothetical protein E5V27_24320 [Mesorhizobium sp.]TIX78994.1 MAG: hypothetical protein E5V21_15280 [Mesorhizobium sp.]